MADVVLRRGELVYRRDVRAEWQRCWVKMYADRVVDHTQAIWLATKQVVRVEPISLAGPSPWVFRVTVAGSAAIDACVASQEERDGWIRCLMDAKRAYLAENGKLLFQAAHSPMPDPPAFVRFADSDSEAHSSDDDDSLSETDDLPASLKRLVVQPGLKVPPPSALVLTLACYQRMVRDRPRVLTIVHVEMETKAHGRFVAPIALDDDSLRTTHVDALKKEALGKLKHKVLHSLDADGIAADATLRELTQDDAMSFVLVLPDAIRDVWLRNEEKPLCYYLDMKLESASDTVHLSLRQVQAMPPPPLQVEITGNANKVSDLSQKLYTTYTIQVVYNDVKWTVVHRFQDFLALDDAIKNDVAAYRAYLPPLPKKKAITPKKGLFVAKRQCKLQAYLQDVVALPGLAQNIHVMTFLGVVSMARNREVVRSVLHVSAVHACLSYGDIILFKTRFGASKVQRKITGARYDHAAIVVPGSTPPLLSLLEATGEGIQVYALKPRLQAYGREVTNAIVARRVLAPRSPTTLAKIQEFVLGVEGNAYSIFGILNRSKVEKEEKTTKYFCSELVAAALMHLDWLEKDVPPSFYWPGNFEEGGELERHVLPGVTLGPELALDCKFLEVGRAQ
ncbi:hypothetical protein SPRG_13490 [Saprolegnia parasitica CBS 223.65]|uniref:PX domain-containing protein n=1 Tax=Saprolegnia parasitica (strain CBS 223.65) TaxID=695850 RepID=A0A067BU32_SAPPC|nr:hypothetical protein SPRG_13490 [Saprolegnia parasitica CBS 223.65]KDO20345.1 hypothetical protein SPRG_13490 [Saprolegnia parasitica CBS 223.65]|eukprot:XP_012208940.1 hypothetical protein SPRG_13490 [Saprolegnia parasitica CBS 223.65]